MNFHPFVQRWFRENLGDPTEPQRRGWPLIERGENLLLAAPTGSGKTLAAFLCSLDGLIRRGLEGRLREETTVLYVSPLKALANDIQKNLLEPLQGIMRLAEGEGKALPELRPLVRTGDTPSRDREAMKRRPPHILVTTPESLFILLTSKGGRRILKKVETVIVDEVHALAGDKRGAHLALSLERLEDLTGRPIQRIGLSATQKPIEEVARFLFGKERSRKIVDVGHRRKLDLAVEVPRDELSAVASAGQWEEIYDRLARLIRQHGTTLIFVNTRRLAERVTHHLKERLEEGAVASHHGSLARDLRLGVEDRLKRGELQAVVATASLELGIDIGSVELVCQLGSTRSISLALQRIGRSGHWKGAVPRGRLFPLTRDDLLECAALVWAIRSGELDRLKVPELSLDILCQQIVAAAASREWQEDELYRLIKRAGPYRNLTRETFEELLELLSEGFSRQSGRRRAYLYRDRLAGRLKGRRGARLAAITSGGAIPENANYVVKADPEEVVVGDVDEDFAIESIRGDVFVLGSSSWRIRRVEKGVLRVEDARGAAPTIPFWQGEAPGRTEELSEFVSRLRSEIAGRDAEEAARWLEATCTVDSRGARQAVGYVHGAQSELGVLPTRACIVAERFFDESGGMQLLIHSPFGAAINKAWGLGLRKRFCRSFNFELQASATDNGILISLSDQHSFPLESVFDFLRASNAEEIVTQAVLGTPLFPTRWRWTATRALALLRFSGGRKVPPPLQRMRSDDLLAAVFPQQAACLENIVGDIVVPDHPLVREALHDCLHEAMDIGGLRRLLKGIEVGTIRTLTVETTRPSLFAHEMLNAGVFTFLDDAPLEERRARAVQTRRSLTSETARELARLDLSAIEEVASEARPSLQRVDEVHDHLIARIVVPEGELASAGAFVEELEREGRAVLLRLEASVFWVSIERLGLALRVYGDRATLPRLRPEIEQRYRTLWPGDLEKSRAEGVVEILRHLLAESGPLHEEEMAGRLGLSSREIEEALVRLEGEGTILRGSFTPGLDQREWCDRRLLARIHRRTLGRLRRSIEPVTPADYLRFLFRWQGVDRRFLKRGEDGVMAVMSRLQGFEAPAVAWEKFILPARVSDYEPSFLDHLCLSGALAWARLRPPGHSMNDPDASSESVRPTRVIPIGFGKREVMSQLLRAARSSPEQEGEPSRLSHAAAEVSDCLGRKGALFVEDLVAFTGRLPVEVEEALWELTAAGRVTADGFDNLRMLIDSRRRLRTARSGRRASRNRVAGRGRWALLEVSRSNGGADAEALAWQLLDRWGVVFRDLMVKESLAPAWSELLLIYRQLEARGKIRGGRFVSGFVGEQFALPHAVEVLRAVRSEGAQPPMRISAADPLNLVGIVLPGERIRPHPETILELRGGALEPLSSPTLEELPGRKALHVEEERA